MQHDASRLIRCCIIAAGFLLAASGVHGNRICSAQDIRIAVQRGPHFVGDPTVIQIQVAGVDGGSDVTCKLVGSSPAALSVNGPQVSQSSSSFTQIINGRVTSSETISYRYNFFVTSDREGSYEVGPFEVLFDGKKQVVEAISIEFERLAEDPDMELSLSLPKDRIYVGERVPLTIRWSFAGNGQSLQHAFANLQIRSPLFEQFDFADDEPQTRTTLSISTAQGNVDLDAEVSQERRNGRDFVVVTSQRTLLANNVGTYSDVTATARTERVTNWGRDFFGELRARGATPALASSEPLSFKVLPIPTNGRPNSFSGAVGTGFSIDVAANRSVVRVGDPIALDFTIRGDGNIEQLSLPPLEAGLDPNRFQLPDGQATGTISGNAKQFKVNVRVKDSAVNQLPAIPFSWFDADTEQFQTTSSKPIALSVMEAQIVSATDVFTTTPSDSEAGGRNAGGPSSAGDRNISSASAVDLASSFVGANLAIEKDIAALVSSNGNLSTRAWVVPAFYVAGVLVIGIGFALQRAAKQSPEASRQKMMVKRCKEQIRDANSKSLREAVSQIGSALRHLIAEFPNGDRRLADSVLAECDTLQYSPHEQNDAPKTAELVERGLKAVVSIVGKAAT